MKIKTVENAADMITEAYKKSDYESEIDKLAFKNSLQIFLTDKIGNVIYSSDEHGQGGVTKELDDKPYDDINGFKRPLPRNYSGFLNNIFSTNSESISYTIKQDKFSGETLIYGCKISDIVLYISTPLEPLDATTGILRKQLFYVTVISLILGFIVAFFISKKLSKPIVEITKKAGSLANGDYSVNFEKGSYSEVDDLSDTLNHTAHELNKVEQLRKDLIANISHDFRTPLTMIKGYAEMIEEVSADDKKKLQKHVSIIKQETERLERLVNDILDLSLLQSDNEKLCISNVNLSESCKKIITRFELLLEREGFIFKSNVEHDLYVLADEQKIEQVLYNLIGNAVNYAGDEKEIEVRLADLGSIIRFEVEDHGQGISEEDIPYVWERYYKGGTHKRPKISTGIGLSIVKNILEIHDAKYGITTILDKGTTFWFELKK